MFTLGRNSSMRTTGRSGSARSSSTTRSSTLTTSSARRSSGTTRSTPFTETSLGKKRTCFSLLAYYLSLFSDRFVSNVNVPFLVLQAQDDPICTYDNMPLNDLLKNPNCFIVKTRHGGHCDFFTRVEGKSKAQRVRDFNLQSFFHGL